MIKEIFYAVRIGTPGKHIPYLMRRDGGTTPHLFHDRKDAQEHVTSNKRGKVVKVEILELPSA